jgi:Flp pilus assembly protein TadD
MSGETQKEVSSGPVGASASPAGETPEAAHSLPLKSQDPVAGVDDRRLVPAICFFLAAMVWVVFGQTLHHGFVNYDDNLYVYENPAVIGGLNPQGIAWAFTHFVGSNWHPLTILSHMLDCQLYGLDAGGHHLTNVLLHTASAILLFLVLRRMTGFLWRSAFVAAVFAIHPLRVESVAWIAERKDVLSGLFFMLTLWAYTRYVAGGQWLVTNTAAGDRAPGPRPDLVAGHDVRSAGPNDSPRRLQIKTLPAPGRSRFTFHASRSYGLVLLFFALGLMSKPMLVTLPFVLLLLDYWPLGRVTSDMWRVTGESNGKPSNLKPQLLGAAKRGEDGSTLLLEKLPLFGLAAASCAVTMFAQTEAIQPAPLWLRIGNALVSCVAYLGQMLFPAGLALDYPHPGISLPLWKMLAALVLLLFISAATVAARRQRPWFLFGWLWYVGMLVPVSGIVQTGSHARADRYTYLPQIGLVLLLTWAVADLCAGGRHRRWMLGGLATIILAALIFCARRQTAYWQNSETLWTHTLARTSPDNFIAQDNLGNALLQKGDVAGAILHFQKALQLKPDSAEIHNNLGSALAQSGKVEEAVTHFQTALQIMPDYAQAHYNLGYALLQKGSVSEAVNQFQTALQLDPGFAAARNNLDLALRQKATVDETLAQYQQALQLNPDSVEVLNNLAWVLATCPDAEVRDGAQAVRYAGHACELTHYGVTVLVGTLAAAYAEAGRYDDAVATAEKACALAQASGDRDLLERNQKLLAMYRARQPYHEPVAH